jgi:hypothetical protein
MPYGPILLRIMDGIFHACGLPNVFGVIHGSHISLSQKLDKRVTAIPIDDYFVDKKVAI